MSTLVGVFMILHGLVHMLYFGFSQKYFEFDTPIPTWPQGSWVFSPFLGASTIRGLAGIFFIVATVMFIASGLGIFVQAGWWNTLLLVALVFSSVGIFLFWDGSLQQLPGKGFVGILINVVAFVLLYMLDKPLLS